MILKELRNVLDKEAEAIKSIKLDESFERAIVEILNTNGKVITTGMGKAGLIAQKFSATLKSVGVVSVFLHPGEALHGDLGVLSKDDCIVAFSNSGKTREVLKTLELAGELGVKSMICLTSNPESEIQNYVNIVVDIGKNEEVDPWNLLPTTSSVVMLSICDAIAVLIIKIKNIEKKEFALRHHDGYLGCIANGGNNVVS